MNVAIRGVDSEVSCWSFDGGDDARVIVGADPSCDWRIRGMGIGRRHLELAWFEHNLWVRALAHSSGRELAAPGDWQLLEAGAAFDLGAARVTAGARSASSARAPWDVGEGQVPTVIAQPEIATVITSCASPRSAACLDDLPAVIVDPTGQVGNHTAIVQPSQLRRWAAEADDGSAHQVFVSGDPAAAGGRPTRAAQRLRASAPQRLSAAAPQHFHAAVPEPSHPTEPERFVSLSEIAAGDSVADVFALPPPIEAPAPAVAKPPLWETLWWAIPGRAVLIVSAIAALVCFVWFPRLLSAGHDAEEVQTQVRTVAGGASAKPVSLPLPIADAPYVPTPELAAEEQQAAAHLVAGNLRAALTAYRALEQAAPEVPAYAQMVYLLARRVAAPAGCDGRATRGGRCDTAR